MRYHNILDAINMKNDKDDVYLYAVHDKDGKAYLYGSYGPPIGRIINNGTSFSLRFGRNDIHGEGNNLEYLANGTVRIRPMYLQ